MASNGTRLSGRSALSFVDESTDGSSPFGYVARLHLARDVERDPQAALEWAGAAMAQVERVIHHLWRDSMKKDDRAMSQRLAELSHAVQRAARRLEHDNDIGYTSAR